MILTASDIYTYFRPSKCDLRVFLRHKGEKEADPGPYEEVLRRLGIRHEQSHLQTFPSYVDLSRGSIDQREKQTKDQVAKGAPVLYQPVLKGRAVLDGVGCDIIGEPDFLINESGQYIIRDSKISRRINDKDHPEILLQLEIYGWLFEQIFGQPALNLQVHSGTGQIVTLPYDGGIAALEALRKILILKRVGVGRYTAVGWTKCSNCGFNGQCWERAVRERDVALVSGVDQGLATALHDIGINTTPTDYLAY